MHESVQHAQLLEALRKRLLEQFGAGRDLVIFDDGPALLGAEKPPAILGFVPDLFACSQPPALVVVGEAKTENDLDSEHSRRQIAAFMAYVAGRSDAFLMLAVPWQASATARNLLARLRRELPLPRDRTIVVDVIRKS